MPVRSSVLVVGDAGQTNVCGVRAGRRRVQDAWLLAPAAGWVLDRGRCARVGVTGLLAAGVWSFTADAVAVAV